MPDNPYKSPAAPLVNEPTTRGSVISIWAAATRLTARAIIPLLIFTVVYGAVTALMAFMLLNLPILITIPIGFFSAFAAFAFYAQLIATYLLHKHDHSEQPFKQAFSQAQGRFMSSWGAVLLLTIFVVLIELLREIMTDFMSDLIGRPHTAITLGLWAIEIIVLCKFIFCFFLITNRNNTAMDALRQSIYLASGSTTRIIISLLPGLLPGLMFKIIEQQHLFETAYLIGVINLVPAIAIWIMAAATVMYRADTNSTTKPSPIKNPHAP